MTMPFHYLRRRAFCLCFVLIALATACSDPEPVDDNEQSSTAMELSELPSQYSATWLINAEAAGLEDVASPFLYREVGNDETGNYLVQAPNHLALQRPNEVIFCSAIARVPIDPYCASAPRAEGAPHVLSYPVQLLRDWGPSSVYELATYREVSLAAATDATNWNQRETVASNNIAVECFTVTGETSAAATGFEICFTNDDLHLVASVDLQSDLVFEVDLLSYERFSIDEDFETSFEDFIEPRPDLQEQLLALYPDIPAARPTPTPSPG